MDDQGKTAGKIPSRHLRNAFHTQKFKINGEFIQSEDTGIRDRTPRELFSYRKSQSNELRRLLEYV